MITAKIKKGLFSMEEIDIHLYVNGWRIGKIGCKDYEIVIADSYQCMIGAYTGAITSYIHVDQYTCETWREE